MPSGVVCLNCVSCDLSIQLSFQGAYVGGGSTTIDNQNVQARSYFLYVAQRVPLTRTITNL